MGTYTILSSLPRPPEADRRTSLSAQIANFGIPNPARAEDLERGTLSSRFLMTLGSVMFGLPSGARPPWVVHPPERVGPLRDALTSAWTRAQPELVGDELQDWWAIQYAAAERVLSHANARREWVVSVHEFDETCFDRGGVPSLEQDPGRRWQSVAELERELAGIAVRLDVPPSGAAPVRADYRSGH
jgi:hypothetical protein